MKLLVVDDNQRVRNVIRDLMAGVADELVECNDGAEAVALYGVHRPDWVLLDIRMETMDGLEATRRLLAAHPRANIVIVTSAGDPETRDAAARAGARDLVAKQHLLDLLEILTPG